MTACSTTSQIPEEVRAGPDPIEVTIAEGVGRIALAFERLAMVQSAVSNEDLTASNYDFDESDLAHWWLEEIDLIQGFDGDVLDFVKMVSAVAEGLDEPRVITKAGRQHQQVSFKPGKRKVISFIADAGYQAGDNILIQPLADKNYVMVTYR